MNDPLDDEIDRLARAFADETGGKSDASDATLEAILRAPRSRPARHTTWLAAAAALVLVVGTPTAWAWWTGRLPSFGEEAAPQGESPEMPVIVPSPSSVPEVPEVPEAPVAPIAAPVVEEEAPVHEAPASRTRPVERSAVDVPVEAVEVEPAPVESAIAAEETVADTADRRAYETAHALHFGAHDPDAALAAWDGYLADHPSGRFVVEARYNRALTLVRLGRRDAAREALAPFADGDHGAYRQREARALIDAMEQAP